MRKRSWIRNVFIRPTTRPKRKAPPACRPVLEALEGRLVPTTFTVSRLADDAAAGSLRWAITQANTVAGDDIINFSVTGTIQLGAVLPDLNSNLAIQGPGAASLTVRRNTGGDYGIFRIPAGRTVALSGLTIANGSGSSPHGGGITNNGTLTVNNSTLSGNFGSGGQGGGITNAGTLTVNNSTLSGNSTQFYGGGIRNHSALTVRNSTLSGNSAPSGGGGINNIQGALTVSNSTLSGNSAGQGGGIASSGALTVSNSTLSGNSASAGGGIQHSTIPPSPITLNNSLVVNSPSGGDIVAAVTGSNNLTGAVPLGPLQNNSGPTPTHALPGGSPALNAGNPAAGFSLVLLPKWDQRGPNFTRIAGGRLDIGAFEAQGRMAPGQDDPSHAPGQAAVAGEAGRVILETSPAMAPTVHLPPETEQTLLRRAAQGGPGEAEYLRALVEEADRDRTGTPAAPGGAKSFDEILDPAREGWAVGDPTG